MSKPIPLFNNTFFAVKIKVLLYSVFSPIIANFFIPVFIPKSIICSISSSYIFPKSHTFLFFNSVHSYLTFLGLGISQFARVVRAQLYIVSRRRLLWRGVSHECRRHSFKAKRILIQTSHDTQVYTRSPQDSLFLVCDEIESTSTAFYAT